MSFILLGILNSQAAGAAGAGAYDLLETQTLLSDTASITFTGLDSYTDYKHLQLRAVFVLSSNTNTMQLQMNSDTGANYSSHTLVGDGSSVSSSALTSDNQIDFTGIGAYDGGAFQQYGAAVIDILDFSDTNKYTTVRALGGNNANVPKIALSSGLWMNTSAVTSITFESASNYREKSRFSLYGVK